MCYQFKKSMNGTHTIGILSLFTSKVESMLCWGSKGLEAHKGPLKNIRSNAPWDVEFLMGSYLVAKELQMLTKRISVGRLCHYGGFPFPLSD